LLKQIFIKNEGLVKVTALKNPIEKEITRLSKGH
jgi:hypothetical protein